MSGSVRVQAGPYSLDFAGSCQGCVMNSDQKYMVVGHNSLGVGFKSASVSRATFAFALSNVAPGNHRLPTKVSETYAYAQIANA